MMKKVITLLAGLMLTLALHTESMGKHRFQVHGKVDIVSDYIWRGACQGSGFSAQPSLPLSYAGLYLNAWGNQNLSKNAKEFDLNLSYS